MPKVIVICGPTASGKSDFAVALAKELHTEIISADSMLVYRGLDVGTAKPSIEERCGIKHHMIDVVLPTENYSVSDYEKEALPIVERLLSEGKNPIVCGGTGFYITSLLYRSGFGGKGADTAIREKYEKIAEEKGKEYLHALLREVDEKSAGILHPNDVKRVVRALEIFETTGKKKSDQQDEKIARFPFSAYSFSYPREELYERINFRVEKMFDCGLKEEVEKLLLDGIGLDKQCMQGIGYKEVAMGLKEGQTEEEIKESVKKATRNYAKRQITFFKRLDGLKELSPREESVQTVLKEIQ